MALSAAISMGLSVSILKLDGTKPMLALIKIRARI
jgi:hypothetical protein